MQGAEPLRARSTNSAKNLKQPYFFESVFILEIYIEDPPPTHPTLPDLSRRGTKKKEKERKEHPSRACAVYATLLTTSIKHGGSKNKSKTSSSSVVICYSQGPAVG